MQGVIALIPFGHRHPAIASRQALPGGIDHREFTAALTETLTAEVAGGEINAATLQQAFGDELEINRTEIHIGANGREIGVKNALHHQLIALLIGIEVVEDKPFRSINQPGLLACKRSTIPRHQPELGLATSLGTQTLGRTLLPQDKRQGVEIDCVLKEHRPIGRDREVVQKGKALEAVAPICHQLTRPGALGGELHQPQGAARACLHPKGDHAGFTVVAGIKARVGAEGFAWLEHPIQQGQTPGLEGGWIKSVGRTGLPKGQQVVAQAHHMGIGDVLEPQVKGIGQRATGLLGAEHAAIQHLVCGLLRQPALGAHKAIREKRATFRKAQGADHAVAIEGMVNPTATALQPAGPIAIEAAAQLRGNLSTGGNQGLVLQLHLHIAKGSSPVIAVVGAWR